MTINAIHNARIQLLATALNNLGVAAVLAGVIAPTINGNVGGIVHIGVWLIFGAGAFAAAHAAIGRLK